MSAGGGKADPIELSDTESAPAKTIITLSDDDEPAPLKREPPQKKSRHGSHAHSSRPVPALDDAWKSDDEMELIQARMEYYRASMGHAQTRIEKFDRKRQRTESLTSSTSIKSEIKQEIKSERIADVKREVEVKTEVKHAVEVKQEVIKTEAKHDVEVHQQVNKNDAQSEHTVDVKTEVKQEVNKTEVQSEQTVDVNRDVEVKPDTIGELELAAAVSICPICSMNLHGLNEVDVSVHVNNCLDSDPLPDLQSLVDNTQHEEQVEPDAVDGVQHEEQVEPDEDIEEIVREEIPTTTRQLRSATHASAVHTSTVRTSVVRTMYDYFTAPYKPVPLQPFRFPEVGIPSALSRDGFETTIRFTDWIRNTPQVKHYSALIIPTDASPADVYALARPFIKEKDHLSLLDGLPYWFYPGHVALGLLSDGKWARHETSRVLLDHKMVLQEMNWNYKVQLSSRLNVTKAMIDRHTDFLEKRARSGAIHYGQNVAACTTIQPIDQPGRPVATETYHGHFYLGDTITVPSEWWISDEDEHAPRFSFMRENTHHAQTADKSCPPGRASIATNVHLQASLRFDVFIICRLLKPDLRPWSVNQSIYDVNDIPKDHDLRKCFPVYWEIGFGRHDSALHHERKRRLTVRYWCPVHNRHEFMVYSYAYLLKIGMGLQISADMIEKSVISKTSWDLRETPMPAYLPVDHALTQPQAHALYSYRQAFERATCALFLEESHGCEKAGNCYCPEHVLAESKLLNMERGAHVQKADDHPHETCEGDSLCPPATLSGMPCKLEARRMAADDDSDRVLDAINHNLNQLNMCPEPGCGERFLPTPPSDRCQALGHKSMHTDAVLLHYTNKHGLSATREYVLH